jgi:hypothetical protein
MTEMDWRGYLFVGLVVTVVGALLTHNLATRRDRQTARRNAAVKFRAAFLSALSGLSTAIGTAPIFYNERESILSKARGKSVNCRRDAILTIEKAGFR